MTYTAGSDGSVGFAVPADWNPSDATAMDEVLATHNERVEEYRSLLQMLPESNVKGISNQVFSRYKALRSQVESAIEAVAEEQTLIDETVRTIESLHSVISRSLPNLESKNLDEAKSDYEKLLKVAFRGIDENVKKLSSTGSIDDLSVQTNNGLGALEDAQDAKTMDEFTQKIETGLTDIVNGVGEIASLEPEPIDGELSSKYLRMYNELERQMKSMRMMSAKSADERYANKNLEPDAIPNYRLAMDESPRVCGSCRFFKSSGSEGGTCTAFGNEEVDSNYVCDAWQAQELTDVHTVVRAINALIKSGVIHVNYGTETEGVVPASEIMDVPNDDSYFTAEVDIIYQDDTDSTGLRAAIGQYLPTDRVYSYALRSVGDVIDVVEQNSVRYYVLKLLNSDGQYAGTAVAPENDLSPKSKSAVKHRRNARKSLDDELNEMIEEVRSIYKALDGICSHHKNFTQNPLTNKGVLTPVRETMLNTLEKPVFKGVTTGRKRKYYRALQDALWSIGAARQVLFSGVRTIQSSENLSDNYKRAIMKESQSDAYDRVAKARDLLYKSLTNPSATHGDKPPMV